MIAIHEHPGVPDDVAWLGGWRGDRLFLSERGGPFRHLADLGWDPLRQSAPQRRMLLTAESLFVLEPVNGPFLLPPLRVRRFDRAGKEYAAEERPAEGAEDGDASLYFHMAPEASPSVRLVRCGIDPESGRPTTATGSLDLRVRGRRKPLSGTPLSCGGDWWYPVRMEGLVRGDRLLRGEPAGVQAIRGAAVCAGVGGLWIDGEWTRVPGMGRVYPRWRPPLGRTVAPVGDRGLAVLPPRGGRVPVYRGEAGSLPPGTYSDLVARADGLFAIAAGDEPEWVAVQGA